MDFLRAGFFESIVATVIVLAATLSAAGWGALLSRFSFKGVCLGTAERLCLSIGAGLILLSLLILTAGTIRVHPAVFTALLAPGIFLFFSDAAFLKKTIDKIREAIQPNFFGAAFVFAVLFALAASWVGACAPPIGTDALSYHLTHPKIWAETGRITHLPGTRESLWPYLTEMLFLTGLVFRGTIAATLFHWILYPLTALAAYAIARRLADARAARIALLVWLYTPAAFSQSTHAYVDVALAFYTSTAFLAYLVYRDHLRMRTAFAVGCLCGGALAVKYLALAPFMGLFLLVAFSSRQKIKDLSAYVAGAVLAGGIWYARSWVILGNPFYPFFARIFGTGTPAPPPIAEGMGMGLGDLLKLFWNLALSPDSFGGEIIGPFYLALFLPGLLFLSSIRHKGWETLFYTAWVTVLIFFQSQVARFFLAAAPLWAVGAGAVVSRLQSLPSRVMKRVFWAGFGLLFLSSAAIFVWRVREAIPVMFGTRTAQEYLERNNRSFPVYRYLTESTKSDEQIFDSGDPCVFYGDRTRLTVDGPYFRRALEGSGETIFEFLERRDFPILWFNEGFDTDLIQWAQAHGYSQVFEHSFYEKPATFHYVVYQKTAS